MEATQNSSPSWHVLWHLHLPPAALSLKQQSGAGRREQWVLPVRRPVPPRSCWHRTRQDTVGAAGVCTKANAARWVPAAALVRRSCCGVGVRLDDLEVGVFSPPCPPVWFGHHRCHASCHLQGCRGDAVALLPRAQAVPLLHSRPVCTEHPAPVVGLRSTCGVLTDDDPPNEVVAALHVVPIHCGKQKRGQIKESTPLSHPGHCQT